MITLKAYLRNLFGSLRPLSLALALLPVLGMNVCSRDNSSDPNASSSSPKVSGPAAAVATTSYQGEGRVISLKPRLPSIEIDHQEIKGLMPAMTMEFYVKDKSLLDGLRAGDQIEFTIDNGVGGVIITTINKK